MRLGLCVGPHVLPETHPISSRRLAARKGIASPRGEQDRPSALQARQEGSLLRSMWLDAQRNPRGP